MKIDMEKIGEWYKNNEYRWWTPDVFEEEICKEPLFPLMLSVFLKLNPEPRMVTRMNIEFPNIDSGIYAEDYRLALSKEVKKDMSKEAIKKYEREYVNKPAELVKPEKDIMDRTYLLDDTRLAYLFLQHGLVYSPETKEVFEPGSSIQRIELLPPQPIEAVLDYYVYHTETGCGVQRVAMNLGRDEPLRVYPDLSDVNVNNYTIVDLVDKLEVQKLSTGDASMLFEIIKSYPFNNHASAIDGLSSLFEHQGFSDLVESMGIDLLNAQTQVLQVQTWLELNTIKSQMVLKDTLGLTIRDLITNLYDFILEPSDELEVSLS